MGIAWRAESVASCTRRPVKNGSLPRKSASGRSRTMAAKAANIPPIPIDVDSDRLSPRTAFGKLCPILHCAIGVGRGIGILGMGPPRRNGHRRGDSDAKHQSHTITHVASSLLQIAHAPLYP